MYSSVGCAGVEVVVRCTLVLAEVALAMGHTLSATQLALAALRRIQLNHTSSSSGSSCDMVLWLQCRRLLAQTVYTSLSSGSSSLSPPGLSCVLVCEEGIHESQSCGDPELAAVFLYMTACHLFLRRPCPLSEVQAHTQQALQQLESVPQLSQHGELLQAKASLLLAESMARLGPVKQELATAFRGVYKLLQRQVRERERERERERVREREREHLMCVISSFEGLSLVSIECLRLWLG